MEKVRAKRKTSAGQKGMRFSIRASALQKKVIAQAARIKATSMSEFVLEQALLAAQHLIADQTHFTLPKKQWMAFHAALDAPPKSVPELRRLLTKPGIFDAGD
ncbi:MAG: DUF1778 domain-containing protein [Acidobacteria bacterium]|nr:DUF1778 domain-containing protein [Acidobacteriota bacterium]